MKRLFNYLLILLIILLPFNIFAETSSFVDEYNSSEIIKKRFQLHTTIEF